MGWLPGWGNKIAGQPFKPTQRSSWKEKHVIDSSKTVTLISTLKNYIKKHVTHSAILEKDVVEAYDTWAENYDAQPGNLMLDLDKRVFSNLLEQIEIKNKNVADIGCGTGRHWGNFLENDPAGLTGFDVSGGMLGKLKNKYPFAQTQVITDNLFSAFPDASYDLIVSTLTVAHIKEIEEALSSWCRISKQHADIVITDFHPDALAFGGKRTFPHGKVQISVENYVHPVPVIKLLLLKNGFRAVNEITISVDETVKHYYEQQSALHVYEKFKGFPIIYGIHFRRA